jgi:hypothetical protein
MGVLSFIFFICAFRTNVVFVMIFFSLTFCFLMITAAFWALADDYTGNAVLAGKLLTVCSTYSLSVTEHITNMKIGWRCFWICHMHVWLVHPHRSSLRHR